jgi:spoIIIJ-associated protein
VEWVETTGRSVAEAKDAALDELGVDEADAEFEVLAEAQHGLFGRLRAEARVRARVKPTAPRAKEDRRGRDRRKRSESRSPAPTSTATDADTQSPVPPAAEGPQEPGGSAGSAGGGRRRTREAQPTASSPSGPSAAEPAQADSDRSGPPGEPVAVGDAAGADEGSTEAGSDGRRRRRRGGHRPGEAPTGAERARAERPTPRSGGADEWDDDNQAKGTAVEVDLDRQAEIAVDFLTKLVAEFGTQAQVTVVKPDPDTVEIQLEGNDLGLLIGPKGQTLVAVQNLTRTAVFNETGGSNGHINVDVSGYRQKRTEALVRFAEQAANHVKTSGQRTALEPMSSIDRKIVHDTISTIDGVSTISEGEEPRRRVVVLPA